MAAMRSIGIFVLVLGALVVGAIAGVVGVMLLSGLSADSVRFASSGRDISAHGGKSLEVRSERETLWQTCNGVCDDLRLAVHGAEDSYSVRVLDGAGHEVARGGAGYVTRGITTSLTVSGREKLEIKAR